MATPAARSFAGSVRGLSTSTAATTAVIPGQRVAVGTVTSTGGSGADSTKLSTTLDDARKSAVGAYREILRDIPDMRENFTIIEDEPYVRRVIRAQFDKNAAVTDPKIIDMLVFKARQEAGEIRNQWKSRYHVYKHITNYKEEQRVLADIARDDDIEENAASGRRDRLLMDWKAKGMIPNEIESWKAFQHWRQEEDTKFNAFAEEKQLFTSEQIERNDKAKGAMGCTIV